ncbi:MAG: hypothetical protein QXJ07_01045 [Candidatus Bathyarchaeia archaeon]
MRRKKLVGFGFLLIFVGFCFLGASFKKEVREVDEPAGIILFAHAEIATMTGVDYFLLKPSPIDGPATILSAPAVSVGRMLISRWVYPLSGVKSIPVSTWTITYRVMKNASHAIVHCDIDILIRKSDGSVRTIIATNVANSPCINLTNAWITLTGTCSLHNYTVIDQTDYLEIDFYIEVTNPQRSAHVKLLVDDSTLPLADQTKVEGVVFIKPNIWATSGNFKAGDIMYISMRQGLNWPEKTDPEPPGYKWVYLNLSDPNNGFILFEVEYVKRAELEPGAPLNPTYVRIKENNSECLHLLWENKTNFSGGVFIVGKVLTSGEYEVEVVDFNPPAGDEYPPSFLQLRRKWLKYAYLYSFMLYFGIAFIILGLLAIILGLRFKKKRFKK